MPPTESVDSKTTGSISVRFLSSYAAVKPAGPAPAITAIFFCLTFSIIVDIFRCIELLQFLHI